MGSQPGKERRPFTHFAIKHGFSHQKRFPGLSLLASPPGRQIPSVPQQITPASCLHYAAVMMCLFLAPRGSDSAQLRQWQWKSFKPRAGFAASPPPPCCNSEHKTLLWKRQKKKKESRWDLSSVKKEWIYSPQDMALLFKHSPQAVVGCSYQKLGMYRPTLCPHL